MARQWFTADTHFGHAMVAGIRGFDDTDAHDAEIVARWNRAVRPVDTVWHLGDVTLQSYDRVADLLHQLNGTIHLIAGNHDTCSPIHRNAHKQQAVWLDRFASVQAYARRRFNGRQLLLSHYPYRGDHTSEERYTQYRLPDEGLWLLHGHTHSRARVAGRQIQVGVDAWDLAPVPLETIMDIVESEET